MTQTFTYDCTPRFVHFAYKFTGKERDSESGNDYFGARYYSSAMGRFMSPDWSAKVEPVPYAKLDNPQSLNLYAYVGNNPMTRFDPDGHIDCSGENAKGVGCHNWFDINGQWSWHQGDSYTYKGADGKDVTAKSSYQYLLMFDKTGTNKFGATTGTLTLYGNDQGKAVASAQVFSGGNGFSPIPNGEYTIRSDIRGSATGPSDLKSNGQELKQFYGIQDIAERIMMPNGGFGDARYEWGSIRAALNPTAGETGAGFQGNYLHGKDREGDWTHGCICNRSENVLRDIRNLDPASVPRIPVLVK
jgi:RHS repeat-associated protein